MFNWFKNKENLSEKSLVNGQYKVVETDSILGRYAVVTGKESAADYLFINYFRELEDANRLAEAYNAAHDRLESCDT